MAEALNLRDHTLRVSVTDQRGLMLLNGLLYLVFNLHARTLRCLDLSIVLVHTPSYCCLLPRELRAHPALFAAAWRGARILRIPIHVGNYQSIV